jgi:hypothetical protein
MFCEVSIERLCDHDRPIPSRVVRTCVESPSPNSLSGNSCAKVTSVSAPISLVRYARSAAAVFAGVYISLKTFSLQY